MSSARPPAEKPARLPCPAYITVGPGRDVRCRQPAGHGPGGELHHALLQVTLPDGQVQAASVVWSSSPNEWDQANVRDSC
jgi:hypothetical protein